MESYKNDQSDVMDRLLRKQLPSSGAPQCGGFDPDLAGAYFEKALSAAEEQAYHLHLAECRSCRKLYTEFFLFASESDSESLQESAAAQTLGIFLKTQETERKPFFSLDAMRAWLFGPQLRWVLPAALVFVVAGTVWFSTNRPMLVEEASQSAGKPYPAASPNAQSKPESEPNEIEGLPSDVKSDAAAPAPLSVQPKSESKDVKTLPSVDLGNSQPDAASGQAYQEPSNVLRQFERGATAPAQPARPEAETARRNADTRKGTIAKEVPADLAAQNSSGESAKSVAKLKEGSAALRTAPAASAAQSGPPAPAESPKEALKPAAPSALSSEAAENKASGSIQGLIIDGAGQIVPGAQVILRDSATGAQRYSNADKKGGFSFTGLPSGNYLVQAQAETLRKEQAVSLDAAQTISNFKMQFDAPPQIAFKADDLKKKAFERDQLKREESVKQEKAKEKDQEVAVGGKTDDKRALAIATPKETVSSGSSGVGARADKDSIGRIGEETRSSNAPAKTDKQARSKTGYKRSEAIIDTDDAVAIKTPSRERKNAKPAIKTKRVGDKGFVFLEGVWTDEDYLSKEKIKDLRVVKLEYKSEAYNKVLNDLPALKPFFQLGEHVIVVYKDAVYAVAKKLRK